MTAIDKLRDTAGPARGRLNYAECAAILAERDRLLAVVEAARLTVRGVWVPHAEYNYYVPAVSALAAALNQLDRPREGP